MTREPSKIRIQTLRRLKQQGHKIVVLTAYDAITAGWAESAGAEVILVGDSLGNTALGHPDTLAVTMDTMIHHCAAVARGARRPLLVGDMPFMSTKVSAEQALVNAGRLMQEGRMEAVKLEGGGEIAPTVARLTAAGLPVMGHIGVLPQSVHQQGGYRLQGGDETTAARLREDARALEQAGVFSLVLENVADGVARAISEQVAIPTIGIGAGPGCDGQVLVLADLLGLGEAPPPPFAKPYAQIRQAATDGLKRFAADVRAGDFPPERESP